MFANFVFQQRGDAAIWVERASVDQGFIDRLTDADLLFADSDCEVIKDQKKIKVGRVTLAIAGRRRTIYVKRYNAFSLRYKVTSQFIRSGAFRSLRGAALLGAAQIPTALPVAAVENRSGGALIKSFFLSEEVPGGETVDAYWRGRLLGKSGREGFALRRRFLAALARLFGMLHSERIYHNDLKDANILAAADPSETGVRFFLLDLEGVARLVRLNPRRRLKNLVQIHRSLGRYLTRSEKIYFLKSYLGSRFAERRLRRQLVASVIGESKRMDRVKASHG